MDTEQHRQAISHTDEHFTPLCGTAAPVCYLLIKPLHRQYFDNKASAMLLFQFLRVAMNRLEEKIDTLQSNVAAQSQSQVGVHSSTDHLLLQETSSNMGLTFTSWEYWQFPDVVVWVHNANRIAKLKYSFTKEPHFCILYSPHRCLGDCLKVS